MDDHHTLTAVPALLADVPPPPSRSSVEKLEEQLAQLAALRGSSMSETVMINTLRGCLPSLRKLGYIPTEPAELDHVLMIAARWALSMRSDDAWQPNTLTELANGPQSPADAAEEPPS